MSNTKKISVVLAVKNGMPYLPKCVQSILNQTEERFELIIVENGSEDETFNYLSSLNDKRITLHSIGHVGLVSALNYGISLAGTPFVAIADSDDVFPPNRLEIQYQFLKANNHIGLIGTAIEYFNNIDGPRWKVNLPPHNVVIKDGLRKSKFVIHNSTIMFRNNLMEILKGYRQDAYPVPDADLFLRACQITELANLTDVRCMIRIHDESFTSQNFYNIIKKYSELTLEYFPKSKDNSSAILDTFYNYIVKVNYWSVKYYRKGIVYYLKGKIVKCAVNLLIASLLNPWRALFYIKNKL